VARRIVIEYTETFRQSYRQLPEAIQKKLQKQLRFLSNDPSHRSLHIHKLNDEWEFYVDVHYRCFFQQKGNVYTVLTVGTHRLVDRYRKR
jgi:mRNA-degrading endonuclease RelE of RelBE toxin-antitoxin system